MADATLARLPSNCIALENYLIVLSDLLLRQFDFVMRFTGHFPIYPSRLNLDLSVDQWHDTLLAGQVQPDLTTA